MLTKLRLTNYKKFASKELVFDKGLNVVLGKNEAGKSSLMEAILSGLFVDANTKSQSFFDGASNWKSRSKQIELELNFLLPEASYKLVRNLGDRSQYLLNQSKSQKVEDFNTIQKILQSELGIQPRSVFESTSFIKQAEIARLNLTADFRQALQRVSSVSTADNNLEANIKELEKELQQLQLGLHRPSKNLGQIKAAQMELADVDKRLQAAKLAWEGVIQAKDKGDQAEGKLGDISKQIEEIETVLANHKKLDEGRKRLTLIEGQLAQFTGVLNSVQSQQLELKQIQAQQQALGVFAKADVNADSEALLQLKQAQTARKETMSELQTELEKLDRSNKLDYLQHEENRQKSSVISGSGLLALALGVCAIILGAVLQTGFISSAATILGVSAVAIAVYLIFYGLVKRNVRSEIHSREDKESISRSKPLQSQIEQLRAKIATDAEAQGKILAKYQMGDINDFYTSKARFNTLKSEEERVITAISAQLNGQDLDALQQEQLKLLQQKQELEINELTPEVKAADLTPNDYLRKRRELDMLLIERKRLEKDSTVQQVRTEENKITYEEVVELEERQQILQERLGQLNERANVLETTIRLLREAIHATSRSVGTVISAEVEKYLPKITFDRYKDIRLTEDYDLEVFATEVNTWIKPLGQVSLGTVDQIYFVARVVLARLLLGGKLNYLFLDDPFVTYDSERLEQTKALLQDLSAETQIFLFTHNERYQDWGKLQRI